MMKVRHAIPLNTCLCTSISRNREKELNYTVPIVVKTLLVLSFECILGLTIENSKLGCTYCGVVVMGVIVGSIHNEDM
jgi:hypothetical protein